jgi:hypothetical protein
MQHHAPKIMDAAMTDAATKVPTEAVDATATLPTVVESCEKPALSAKRPNFAVTALI